MVPIVMLLALAYYVATDMRMYYGGLTFYIMYMYAIYALTIDA